MYCTVLHDEHKVYRLVARYYMMTIRLDDTLESRIETMSASLGVTKSELIRRSVQLFIASSEKLDPWTAGKDVFGKFRSGKGNLAENRKKIVREMISRKFK